MNWFAFAVAFLCVCLGYGLAMLLGHGRKLSDDTDDEENSSSADEPEQGMPTEQAREFIDELQKLAVEVNSDIDRHATKVTEISDELSENTSCDSTAVMAAATQLMEANKQLKADLEFAKEEIQVQQVQLHSYMTEARTDALTGVANRRAFDEELKRRFAQCRRQEIPLSLILADVDHFKRFNDYHGHQVGDETLQGIARVMTEAVREMDMVARYGGEEFVVILPGTSLAESEPAAERLREMVADRTFSIGDADLRVTVSVGLAEARPDETIEELVKRADEALYAAKKAGRDCTFFHDGATCDPITVLQRMTAEGMLEEAAVS